MSDPIPLTDQIAAVEIAAFGMDANLDYPGALEAAANTLRKYRNFTLTANEALEIRRIDDAKLSAAMERSRRP